MPAQVAILEVCAVGRFALAPSQRLSSLALRNQQYFWAAVARSEPLARADDLSGARVPLMATRLQPADGGSRAKTWHAGGHLTLRSTDERGMVTARRKPRTKLPWLAIVGRADADHLIVDDTRATATSYRTVCGKEYRPSMFPRGCLKVSWSEYFLAGIDCEECLLTFEANHAVRVPRWDKSST